MSPEVPNRNLTCSKSETISFSVMADFIPPQPATTPEADLARLLRRNPRKGFRANRRRLLSRCCERLSQLTRRNCRNTNHESTNE
jgi:hypothetical protein